MCKRLRGFTLVELLVVIGVIALLISILLPALSSARKAAATVKCASSLREIGNAFRMYEGENRGYAPPAKLLIDAGTASYIMNKFPYVNATPPYWFDFLAKYVTKSQMGYSAGTGADAANLSSQQLRSVFWGCPAWDPYTNFPGPGGFNPTQVGYGMNGFPEYQPDYPGFNKELGEASGAPYDNQVATPRWNSSGKVYQYEWYKFHQWTIHSQERALAGDCLYWFMEARPPTQTANPNLALPGEPNLANATAQWYSPNADGGHQTTFDWYRHGKYPGVVSGVNEFQANGGKISYNILFADGHVTNMVTKQDSYKAVRMKFPG